MLPARDDGVKLRRWRPSRGLGWMLLASWFREAHPHLGGIDWRRMTHRQVRKRQGRMVEWWRRKVTPTRRAELFADARAAIATWNRTLEEEREKLRALADEARARIAELQRKGA